jgi:hypothetical protein
MALSAAAAAAWFLAALIALAAATRAAAQGGGGGGGGGGESLVVSFPDLPERVRAAPLSVAIRFSAEVLGFGVGGVECVGCAGLSGFSGAGAEYSVVVDPGAEGTRTLRVLAGAAPSRCSMRRPCRRTLGARARRMRHDTQPLGESASRALRAARSTPRAPRHAPHATRPTPRAPRRAEEVYENSSSVAASARYRLTSGREVWDWRDADSYYDSLFPGARWV